MGHANPVISGSQGSQGSLGNQGNQGNQGSQESQVSQVPSTTSKNTLDENQTKSLQQTSHNPQTQHTPHTSQHQSQIPSFQFSHLGLPSQTSNSNILTQATESSQDIVQSHQHDLEIIKKQTELRDREMKRLLDKYKSEPGKLKQDPNYQDLIKVNYFE